MSSWGGASKLGRFREEMDEKDGTAFSSSLSRSPSGMDILALKAVNHA